MFQRLESASKKKDNGQPHLLIIHYVLLNYLSPQCVLNAHCGECDIIIQASLGLDLYKMFWFGFFFQYPESMFVSIFIEEDDL